MKLARTLIKSGLAVAGTGIYLFFRRLFKQAKKTEKEIEEKIKPKKKAVKKSVAIPRQKKTAVKSSINM